MLRDGKRRSRTQVTKISVVQNHRFFSASAGHSAHDRSRPKASSCRPSWPELSPRSFPLGTVRSSAFGCARRCAGRPSQDPCWRVLLRMFKAQADGRLHQTLPTAQIRLALVGHLLRKTSHSQARRKSGRGASLPPPWPRRTRRQLIALQFCRPAVSLAFDAL